MISHITNIVVCILSLILGTFDTGSPCHPVFDRAPEDEPPPTMNNYLALDLTVAPPEPVTNNNTSLDRPQEEDADTPPTTPAPNKDIQRKAGTYQRKIHVPPSC